MSVVKVNSFRFLLDIFMFLSLWLPTTLFYLVIGPYERGFYCGDESIRYPYRESTVPNWLLYFVGALLPIVSIIVIEFFRELRFERRFSSNGSPSPPQHQVFGKTVPALVSNLYIYLGYFCFGAALCQCLTDIGKFTIGRMRPHFIDVCKPSVDCDKVEKFTYIEKAECTATDWETIQEARLSFPSGHSSFGAYSMLFLVLYIHSRLVWPMVSMLTKHLLQNVCVILGVACALSRISDYKHHWSDVLSGIVLGVIVATLTAVHMLGIFRLPHYWFARPFSSDSMHNKCSFGGDQFHTIAELESMVQYRLLSMPNKEITKETNLDLSGLTRQPVVDPVLDYKDVRNA